MKNTDKKTDVSGHVKIDSSKFFLESLLESQKDTSIFAISHEYHYLYFNAAHQNAMKIAYDADIEIGMNVLDCMTVEEDRQAAKRNFDRALNGETHSNMDFFGDGNPSFFESYFHPIVNDKEEIIGASALARDITERKRQEEKIEQITEQWQNTFNAVNDAIW